MTQAIIAPVGTRRTSRSERAEGSEQATRTAPAGRAQQAERTTTVPAIDRDPIVVPTPVFVGGRARVGLVRVAAGLLSLVLMAWLGLAGSAVVGDHSAPPLRIDAEDSVDTGPLTATAGGAELAGAATSGGSTLLFPFERLAPATDDPAGVLGAIVEAQPADADLAAGDDGDGDAEESAAASPTAPAGAAR